MVNTGREVCILGNDVKSVAVACFLSDMGYRVKVVSFAASADEYIAEYQFDKPLCEAWQQASKSGQLIYEQFLDDNVDAYINIGKTADTAKVLWLFVDNLKPDFVTRFFESVQQHTGMFIMSGMLQLGEISALAERLQSKQVFYIPFSFLIEQSIYLSIKKSSLILIGEKVSGLAVNNTFLNDFSRHAEKVKVVDMMTAEFTRGCIMNLFAARLSYINEMSRLADSCSVDMNDVEDILKLDDRVGIGFLHASWGFGGLTLPREVKLLKNSFVQKNISTNLIDAVETINEDQKEIIFRKFWRYFDTNISDKKVVIWGASYKSGSGQTQGSAIHPLLRLLWSYDITTYIYDIHAQDSLRKKYSDEPRLLLAGSPYANLSEVDALFILSWSEKDMPVMNEVGKHSVPVFDAQNLLSKDDISNLFFYTGIGRGSYV